MSSSKEFVFGSDRHHGNAKESDQGGTLISAGDLIDRRNRDYESKEDFKKAARNELENINENYERAIIVAGNHDDTDYDIGGETSYDASVEEIAEEEYDDEDIKVVDSKTGVSGAEHIDLEGLDYDLVLGGSHQGRTLEGKYHLEGPESVEAMPFYKDEELEEAGSELEKEAEDVTLGDMEMLLEEQPQEQEDEGQTETNQGAGSYIRNVLTSIPVAGEKIFEPIYSKVDEIRNEHFEDETEEEAEEQNEEEVGYDVSFEKSDIHERIEKHVPEAVEEDINSMVEEIDGSQNPVIFVDHGEPYTEDGGKPTSLINREVIERADNAEYMLTGHMHGEMNEEIAGTKVRNPGEGYYAGLESFKEGKSKDYEDSEFPADEADQKTGNGQAPDTSASSEEAAAA